MTWFDQLFGFAEPKDRTLLYQRFHVEGEWLYDQWTQRRWRCGRLETPTLAELRQRLPLPTGGRLTLREVVADVQQLHLQHPNAVFQAASQFNLLEMASPELTPDDGIGIYSYDHTQGPACAIACGAGTVYRNYFVPMAGQLGQTAEQQINTLSRIEAILDNVQHQYWWVDNGYQQASTRTLERLQKRLRHYSSVQQAAVIAQLQIGIQWHTEVTLAEQAHHVTQVYCSGVPIGYNDASTSSWTPFAPLLLQATYEATFWAAWEHYQQTGIGQLFLTLVGGGVFENPLPWIIDAIEQALHLFQNAPLEVALVSYGRSHSAVRALVEQWNA